MSWQIPDLLFLTSSASLNVLKSNREMVRNSFIGTYMNQEKRLYESYNHRLIFLAVFQSCDQYLHRQGSSRASGWVGDYG